MATVIVDTCTKDGYCIEACPAGCIHPTKDEADFANVPQLYVNPEECVACGACITVCPADSVHVLTQLPAALQPFIEKNARYYN